MSECQKCHGRTQQYLCNQCQHDLRRQLLGLPTLLAHLEDSALGMTKLSGEETRPLGYESRTPTLDLRANILIGDIKSTLGQWATQLAKDRNYVISPPVSWTRLLTAYRHTSRDYATFLAAHVNDLANDPDVGELCTALKQYIQRGLAVINRRTPPQFCGPCPAMIDDHSRCTGCGGHIHECTTRLMARRGAIEVTCPSCGAVHRVEKLVNELLARADDFKATIPDLYRVLRMLGESVPIRTLYRWAEPRNNNRGSGQLRPAGYLRSDGRRIGVAKHDDTDKPVYLVFDARKIRRTKSEGKQRQ